LGRWSIGLLLLCAVLPFLSVRNSPLVHDDVMLRGPGSLAARTDVGLGVLVRADLFGTPDDPVGQTGFWRPALLLAGRLELVLAGGDEVAAAWLGHVVNLLLHAGATLALHRLLRELGLPEGAALLAAAVFATHPVHAESVAWISGRSDVAATCLGFAGLLCAVRASAAHGGASAPEAAGPRASADGGAGPRTAGLNGAAPWSLRLAAPLLLLAALLCKESALLLVVLAPAVSLLAGRGVRRGIEAAAGALLAYALLRAALFHGSVMPGAYTGPAAPLARWLTWLSILPGMLRLLAWPGPATPIHPVAAVGAWSWPRELPALAVLALLAFLALTAWRRRAAVPAFALLLLLGSLLLLAPWRRFPTGYPEVAAPLYERYLYAAVAAPAALLGWLLAAPLRRRPAAGAALAVLLAVPLGWAAARASHAWSSDEAFARAGLAAAPRSSNLWNHLGVALLERMRDATDAAEGAGFGRTALQAFETALTLEPDQPQAELNRFLALAMLQRDAAWDAADRLLKRHGDDPAVLENVAQWHVGERRWKEASKLFLRALETGHARPGTEGLLEQCLQLAEAEKAETDEADAKKAESEKAESEKEEAGKAGAGKARRPGAEAGAETPEAPPPR